MKSEFIPITIVDDFFKNPDEIRQKALSFDYDYGIKGSYPGFRTKNLKLIDKDLYRLISNKIFSLFLDIDKEVSSFELSIYFQYVSKDFDFGWAHIDIGAYCAGVIYLTPNPPKETGTIIFNDIQNMEKHLKLQEVKLNYYTNGTKHKDYDKIRKENNGLTDKNITVENVYNRALIYPSNYVHSENKFFGDTKENSRLTCVFFLTKVSASGLFPIDRANKIDV
jgi:hypothetical protein